MIDVIKAFDTTAKVIFGLLVLGIVLSLAMAVFTMRNARHDASKAEAGQTFAEGRTAAAQDASAIRDRADARDQSTASIVTQAEKEIRHAPDRNAAADAARRRVCQLSDYRDAQCTVFRTDPGRVD